MLNLESSDSLISFAMRAEDRLDVLDFFLSLIEFEGVERILT
jgi:hypothetical protein